jgi:hypothetical protein
MDEKQLQPLDNELAKSLKISENVNQFARLLKKSALRRPSSPECHTICLR